MMYSQGRNHKAKAKALILEAKAWTWTLMAKKTIKCSDGPTPIRLKAQYDEMAQSHSQCLEITAEVLNSHYATISSDSAYQLPGVKQAAKYHSNHLSEFQIFKVLHKLRPTATGLDNFPAWFLQVGAPLFAAPVADLTNLSLDLSVVPTQRKQASILPIPYG